MEDLSGYTPLAQLRWERREVSKAVLSFGGGTYKDTILVLQQLHERNYAGLFSQRWIDVPVVDECLDKEKV